MTDSRHRSYRCFLLHFRIISAGLAAVLWICGRAYSQPDMTQVEPGAQHPIVVDPASLDLGRLQAHVRHRGSLRLTNTADAPITVLMIKGTSAMRFVGPWPKTLEPGQSANFDFHLWAGRNPGSRIQRGVTVSFGGELPLLRIKLQGETYADVALTPRLLRLDEDSDGRITLSATDGEPFRVLAVDPPVAVGLVDEPKLRHELFIPPDRFENKEARQFTIYLDKPTTDRVTFAVIHRERPADRSQTPDEKLLSAADHGGLTEVERALWNGADPSARDFYGATALIYTVRRLRPRENTLQVLLDAGTPIDASTTSGQTALMWAINYGRSDVAKLLVDRGASVEMRDIVGGTALMWAARYGDHSTIEMLLAAGADPEAVDKLGLRALHWASLRGNLKTTKALLDNQADVDAQSQGRLLTPLMCAARRGYTEVIKVLLEAGADVEATDDAGRTALMWAVKERNLEAKRTLLKAGAHSSAADRESSSAQDYMDRLDAPDALSVLERFRSYPVQ